MPKFSSLLIAACAVSLTPVYFHYAAAAPQAAPQAAAQTAKKPAGRHAYAQRKALTAAAEASGCWVQIWEDENFQDDNDVIAGPGKWNNLRQLPGANKSDWGDEIDSLETGPGVDTLTVWEDEEFKDNSRRFGAGEKVNNLRGSPDLGDTVDSMELTCKTAAEPKSRKK